MFLQISLQSPTPYTILFFSPSLRKQKFHEQQHLLSDILSYPKTKSSEAL